MDTAGLAPYLAGPMCAIFNSSLHEGYIPDLWKTADVVPLPKKSLPTTVESHLQPVSLTPIVSKVFEFFTSDWIKEAIQDEINPHQFGTIKGTSTTHALVDMLHFIQSSLDKPSHHVRRLLLDYLKAFNSVNHHIVLRTLSEAGSPPLLTHWAAAFLLNRKQRVWIGNNYSSLVTLNRSTPQGTIFRPLSFVVHLGDFDTLEAEEFIHVNNTTSCAETTDPSSAVMQRNADYAAEWADVNDMKLNAEKTVELVFLFVVLPANFLPIVIDGWSIVLVILQSYLDQELLCLIDHRCGSQAWPPSTFNAQQSQATGVRTCQLKRSDVEPWELVNIFKLSIHPILEYACQAWHCSLAQKQSLSEDIERVQKHALCITFWPLNYGTLLELSGLPRLSHTDIGILTSARSCTWQWRIPVLSYTTTSHKSRLSITNSGISELRLGPRHAQSSLQRVLYHGALQSLTESFIVF